MSDIQVIPVYIMNPLYISCIIHMMGLKHW